MFHCRTKMLALMATGIAGMAAFAQTHAAGENGLGLSDGVRQLLLAEMQEITRASRDLVTAQVTGDWQAVADLGERIRGSYVMKQQLTETQKRELQEKLPAEFRRIDSEFHARAAKLAAAATARDPELVAFHFSRMLESCMACHATYAADRFSDFAEPHTESHHHH